MGDHEGAPTTVAVDEDGQLYSLMVGANGVVVAVDSAGKIQSVMQGAFGSTTKTLLCDADGRLLAQLMGMYGSTPIPIACDASGRLTIVGLDQTNVTGDANEAQTWDVSITTLVNNLNKIRYAVIHLSGEAWGTISHSIADVWAKFHATTGHKHTAATGDGPQLDHGQLGGLSDNDHTQYSLVSTITALFHATTGHAHSGGAGDAPILHHGGLSGLTDDDHVRYFDKDGSKALTGYRIQRNVDSELLEIHGGTLTAGKGGVIVVGGADSGTWQGGIAFFTPNAAKSTHQGVMQVIGDTDTPYLHMQSHAIKSLLNPVDAQDAATKHYVDADGQAWEAFSATWTWVGTPPDSPTIVYRWTRVGRIVHVNGYYYSANCNGSSLTSVTLPVTPSNIGGWVALAGCVYTEPETSDSASGPPFIRANGSDNKINFKGKTGGTDRQKIYVYFSGSYEVA
jgi:hypothetical protein